jgi:hypothetical protein
MTDFTTSAISRSETATSVSPRVFTMRQVAELLGRHLSVELYDRIDGFFFIFAERVGVSERVFCHTKLSPVNLVQVPYNGSVNPCFYPLRENGGLVPNEGPRLTVVNQLLEFQRGHGTAFSQDVRGYIVYVCHISSSNLFDVV